MEITITLKAEPKLLKAIDVLVECLQAQATLATTITGEPVGLQIDRSPSFYTETASEKQHPLNRVAECVGNITRLLHPQATGDSIHDVGPVDDYLNSYLLDFLRARGLTKITEITAAEDLNALLYTLQSADAARHAAESEFTRQMSTQTVQAPITPIAMAAPVTPPTQTYAAPISHNVPYAPPVSPIPTATPTYSMDQLAVAATGLVDAGKVGELMALLGQYGCQALTQLPAEQYGNFATALRGLGAQI
jgi:hypothetical protein